eukprot:TRINITY_DN24970_c0_g1_i1.p1 TRINITY_DN24970_c0_g1~~TRINITY_DN24970_c0_g1_i1.p1  ORF type:complete len:503 (+),score=122.43 TRINITY_DN24970_c0_g1_i1:58-1566(+)
MWSKFFSGRNSHSGRGRTNFRSYHERTSKIRFQRWATLGVGLGLVPLFMWFNNNPVSMASKKTLPTEDIQTQKQILREMQETHKESTAPPVYRIVLTGGPCGGKSTAMATISDLLLSLGFRVFRVPEAATIVITGTGLFPVGLEEDQSRVFEASIIKTKIALEDIFYNIARAGNAPAVIICDRGTMDTQAYLKKEDWEVLLDEYGWNVVDLRDKRYDAIIHLVTAAIGAERFYTTENNTARTENLAQARDLDFKVLNAWVGHPRIRIIDNSTDFQTKIQRVEEVICQIVGTPKRKGIEHKFIVEGEIPPEVAEELGLKIETYNVEKTYLIKGNNSSGYDYVRRRGQNQTYTYTHSMLRHPTTEDKDIDFAILERPISGREYVTLLKSADTTRCTITKRVQCFLWNNVYYQLQTIIKPEIALTILKTEVEADQVISFPWFLKIEGEITRSKAFSAYRIAQEYQSSPKVGPWKHNSEMYEAYKKIKWPAPNSTEPNEKNNQPEH